MNIQTEYVDIMAPRRAESSVFQFMSRPWSPKKTMDLAKCLKPQQLKEATESSVYINDIIESISISTGVSKEKLRNEVKKYLEEMGLDRKICRVRWVGVAFLKISFMMKISVFVNEAAVFDLKKTMGSNPVLFLPTHRSYADFCLMTYLCYHYDIDLPAVAAGMDFYSMAVVGRAMRDTCAFYIRRTLAGSPLYAATLRQYVRTLVARHPAPVEFFVEATRSRSNKSLHPKYGMLSMSLLPLFSGEVADITVVPVNISYDRLMEHGLFAYEHLGVPKPKESTGGFLKAISRLNDHFGNIYMSLGEPFSVKQYLEENHKMEPLKPTLLTDVSAQQFAMVQDLAHYVVSLQQRCTVHTITNLVALVLMQSVVRNVALHYKEVLQEIQYMIAVLRSLGCTVFENDVKASVDKLLMVHKSMMKFDKEDRLRLLSSDPMVISEDTKKKMKGHTLSVETMVTAVPVIQLQLYVNPTLPWLVPPALLVGLVRRGPAGIEQLSADYHRLRKLFKYEFYYYDREEQKTLQRTVDFCLEYKVLVKVNDQFTLGDDERLQFLLKWTAWPALDTMLNCIEVLKQKARWEQKSALRYIQQEGESRRRHPYCLSLEAAANCLQGLAHVAAVRRVKGEEVNYEVDESLLNDYHSLVKSVTPTFNVDFDRNNTVILDQRVFTSRL